MGEALSPERARWVEQCMPQVTALARSLVRDMPQVSEDDLVSAGYEGLVHAALRYDPKDGTPFPAYAHYRVRGAMIDTARRATPEIRRRARAIRALEATQALLQQAQRNLVHRDVADPRSLRERVAAAAELVAQTTTAVILSRLGPEDPDILVATDADMETRVLEQEELGHVRRVLATCNADESRMIDALYVRGVSMREFAAEVGKSVSSVSRHHAKLIARLSELLRRPVPDHAPARAPATPASPPRAEAPSGLGARGPPDARDS